MRWSPLMMPTTSSPVAALRCSTVPGQASISRTRVLGGVGR
jgi:hypothetical protein